MVLELAGKWLAGKLLGYGFDTAKDLFRQPRMIEAFEKACIEVIKEENHLLNQFSSQALSSPVGIPDKESLVFKLDESFTTSNFPNPEHLTIMLIDCWKARKTQLGPTEASEFFALSEDLVRPIIQKISEKFFRELAQIPELRDPFIIQKIHEISRHQRELEDNAIQYSTILQARKNPIFNIPTELVDQEIEREVDKLRKSRFFYEFDQIRSSLGFGKLLVDGGNLSGGSANLRERGLSWCVRLLAGSEELEKAEEFLNIAITIGDSEENRIAKAFVLSRKKDKAGALQVLAGINSGASRSASLMIVAHHEGTEGALKWMKAAGYAAEDLDSDGKNVFLSYQLLLDHWDDAALTVGTLSEKNFEEAPTLHQLAALTKLIAAVPEDLRAVILTQIPLEAKHFPLASHTVAMEARRNAHKHFLNAAQAAKKLSCPRAARMYDEYALWLELMDPAQATYGKTRLEEKLHDPDVALGFVNYAIQFGVKLDLDAVERDIDRSIAINGGMTMDAAIARFALAFTKPTLEEAANYIDRHYNELTTQIDPKVIKFRQIEMFSRAGLFEKASQILNQLIDQKIPVEEEKNLRRIIAEAEENDPVESRKKQYKSTGSLVDLIHLASGLEEHLQWNDLCEYGRCLFEKTRSLKDAERLVNAFNKTNRSEMLVEFLKANSDLLSQSRNLQISYAWGLYHEGALLESSAAMAEFNTDSGNPNYRALKVNLGIAMGDWASLADYVEDEFKNREGRSAQDLMRTAQLALHLESPRARDLVFHTAAKANDDAAILAGAYFISTSAGWEDDPLVFQWLERAAALSGEGGPLVRMSLKDILNQKPEWDRRESETWRLLSQGKIPLFIAAQSLNRTLIGLTTFPALVNLNEYDPRRKSIIPAFSGKRVPLKFDVSGRTVALDATALLTLSFLKILNIAFDSFDTVYISHSTLSWLFEERQKAAYHQPSSIVNAHKVRGFLATGVLDKFIPSTTASSDLSIQVEEELAAFIAEAEKVHDGKNMQHIVVRPAPVYRISSLMEEEADLSAHEAILSSCLAVVEKLRKKGQLTAEEEKRAFVYLQLHEKPWPNQPDIADGAVLYLDDLAVTYFLHLGIIEKLRTAGLRSVISPRKASETDTLISYECISSDVKEVIESIRALLSSRIESGQVRVGRRCNFDDFEENSTHVFPSVDILALATLCDFAIIDDRFFNQHAYIDNAGVQVPILSTLDLLDSLAGSSSALSDDDRLEHRTRLRQAGHFFVPVDVDELERCLRESAISNGGLVETAELKAIRESVLRVRMRDWLQLPEEALWLDGTLKTFIHVLRNLWVDDVDIEEATARSNWLIEQIDIRGWAHSIVPENTDNVVRIGRASIILLLLTPLFGVQQSVLEAYWNWVEEKILAPTQQQFSEVYEWLVDWYRSHIAKITKTHLLEEDNS